MKIYIDNHTTLPHAELRRVVAAINTQITRDFTPAWGLDAKVMILRKGQTLRVPPDGRIGHVHLTNHGQAAGYHIEEQSGIPAGFVMVDLPTMTKSSDQWLTWTVVLSHEILELIADPFLNLLAKGPHPEFDREVFHYREVCDPVQGLTYVIDGVRVSDFVLPHYYNGVDQARGRNDFLGSRLKAFGWIAQGYIGFWDPRVGARGKYVVYPQYPPKHPAHRALVAKGKSSRLHRYSVARHRDGR